jgi:hypothetical protein
MTELANAASAVVEGQDVFPLLVGVFRLLGYLGFVLVVGTTFFLSWLWPRTTVEWVFIRLFRGGAALVFVSTALMAYFAADGSLPDAFTGLGGAAALARMALLALGVAFAWEMLGEAPRWRVPIVVWQLLLIETYVVDSDAWREPWQLVKGHETTRNVCADLVLGVRTVHGLRAGIKVCADPVTAEWRSYWMRPRWRRLARASSRIALPSASERRSFT